jgi:hypothetical protein
MASYYAYESGTQFLTIELTAIVALQRSGNEFLIHTTGGIVKATQHMYDELLPVWKSAVIKSQLVRKGQSSYSSSAA